MPHRDEPANTHRFSERATLRGSDLVDEQNGCRWWEKWNPWTLNIELSASVIIDLVSGLVMDPREGVPKRCIIA